MVVRAIRPNLAAQVVLLVMLTALVFVPALRNGFIWDDDDHFTANPAMTHPDGLQKIWSSLAVSRYYPLTLTNFWLQRRLWGLNPLPYHAVNILFHAANATLIFLLLHRLNIRGAWVAAALWAVHPVNVESVAWVTELKNTQSGLFFFVSLLCFLRFERRENRGWFALALACFAAALLSKPSAVVLPFVLLLLAWWQRGRIGKADLLRAAPFFALSAVMSLLTIVEQRGHIERSPQDWSLNLTERLIVASKALWFYAAKVLWPVNLSFIYNRWDINADSLASLVPIFGVLGVGVVLWRFRQQNWTHAASFGIGYYVIALLPVLGFFDIYFFRYSFVADHFQYLASLGILTLVVAGATTLLRARGVRRVATVVSVAGLSVLSWRHAQAFHDDETLWRETIATSPRAFLAYCNLGGIFNGKHMYEESERYFRQALQLHPRFLEARSNLGLALTEQGRYAEAEQELREALRVKPDFSKALYCLGHLFYKTKRLPEAEENFHQAILAEPALAEAYYDLGTLLLEQNRREEAAKCYRLALSLKPDYTLAKSNLAKILAENGKIDEAIGLYERAVTASPDTAELHHNLALVYRRAGRLDEAVRQLRTAINLKPGFADGYLELGRTLVADHKVAEAIGIFRRGLEVEPRHMIMGNEMAWVMATAPDPALRNAPQAIQIGERLAELTERKEPKPLDTLAAAYAEAGRFGEAVAAARGAIAAAEAQGLTNLASEIKSRAALYETGRAYHVDAND
jgi:protein O-mannosyl-transferase